MSYIRRNNIFVRGEANPSDYFEDLPAGIYTVHPIPLSNDFYLEIGEIPVLPTKVYGNVISRTEKILNTFSERPATTGVLLSGLKGTGKTLLAKNVVVTAIERGLPVLLITQDIAGPNLDSFLQSFTTPFLVFIDEFEKIFPDGSQTRLLSLLDGAFQKQALFLLTTNDSRKVTEFMLNRPGRVFYSFSYYRLEDAFIEEYLTDNLENKEILPNVINIVQDLGAEVSFDILKAICEELNRYQDKPFIDLLKDMNIPKPNSYNATEAIFEPFVPELKQTKTDLRLSFMPSYFLLSALVLKEPNNTYRVALRDFASPYNHEPSPASIEDSAFTMLDNLQDQLPIEFQVPLTHFSENSSALTEEFLTQNTVLPMKESDLISYMRKAFSSIKSENFPEAFDDNQQVDLSVLDYEISTGYIILENSKKFSFGKDRKVEFTCPQKLGKIVLKKQLFSYSSESPYDNYMI